MNVAANPEWDSTGSIYYRVKRELLDNDPTLSGNDRAKNEDIARQLSWLFVTSRLGQYPRTYTSLLKITNKIADVCFMTESDFMRLTGKTAYRNSSGQFENATDYHGNVVKSECTTFGNDSNGNFDYTEDDVKKIGIDYDIAVTKYDKEQIRQWLCTYNYMQAKYAEDKKKEEALKKMSDSEKYTYYGYPNERMIEVVGMSHD